MLATYKVSKSFVWFSMIKKLPLVAVLSLLVALLSTICLLGYRVCTTGDDSFPVATFFGTALVAGVLVAVVVGVYSVYWCKSFVFSIDDNTVRMKGGILRSVDASTSIDRLTDVTIYQDIFSKWLKYASVGMQTAGSYVTEVAFFGIDESDAAKVKEQIMNRMQKKQ